MALAGASLAAPNKRAVQAPNGDDPVLAAHAAFRAGDPVTLARHAPALKGHVLEPYVEYWRLRLRLEEAGAPEVQAFLGRQAGSYLADRLRADWLKELGRRGEWQSFDLELGPLVQDDLEIRCYGWLSRLARKDKSPYEEAHAMWLEPRELPDGCNALVDKMIGAGELTIEHVWQRVRRLFENGQMSAAKGALEYLPQEEAPDERLLSQAATAPQKLLIQLPPRLEPRATREMALLALVRLARNDPQVAADLLRGSLAKRLPAPDLKYLWGRVAYEGARRLDAQALKWFRLAGGAELNDEQLAWRARAALRAGDWQGVRDAIDPMSAAARQDAAWTYWYGRALGAQGSEDGARAYFLRISGQPHFYGLLAAEELGYVVAVPEPFHAVSEEEVSAAKGNAGLARALELYRLNLRTEATREWIFSIRGMDDQQLLAAAELARRAEVFDRAINTADRTALRHNYKVRFLAPFREVFSVHAKSFELEEAWVLGLVRQESRFIVNAKSSAGAQGLMQLMPATARWVARKIGLKDYHPSRVVEVQTNVTLGTRYLKFVLDDLGHPLLASAAYNAGPGRARRWRDAKPLEGAIYAETIPFNETRDYVKKVMANTMYYSQLVGGRILPLKDRLGVIPARSPSDRFNEELP
ncbi:MAG: transglycosylase SLT domain-containing protein [Burkholderiales bacterium]